MRCRGSHGGSCCTVLNSSNTSFTPATIVPEHGFRRRAVSSTGGTLVCRVCGTSNARVCFEFMGNRSPRGSKPAHIGAPTVRRLIRKRFADRAEPGTRRPSTDGTIKLFSFDVPPRARAHSEMSSGCGQAKKKKDNSLSRLHLTVSESSCAHTHKHGWRC